MRGGALLSLAFLLAGAVALALLAAPYLSAASRLVAGDVAVLDGTPFDLLLRFYSDGLASREAVLVALLTLAFMAVLAAMNAAKRAESEREVRDGVYGDAKVLSGRADLRRSNDFWDGRGVPDRAGLVLGAGRKGYYFDSSVPHCVTVGKTGSGKSQLLVLETMHLLMAAGWNVISTGKSEIVELTGDKASELGYTVTVLDLKGYPGASPYNPMGLVVDAVEAGDADAAARLARQVARDLIPMGGSKDTYFPRAARNVLASVVYAVAQEDIPRGAKCLASVAATVAAGTAGDDPRDPSAGLKAYIRSLGEGCPAYAMASDLLSDGGVTTAGKNVLSNLKEALSIFSDPGLAAITSGESVSITDLIEGRSVVYIQMLDEGDPYSTVYNCFLNQWWDVAQRVAARNGGRLPHVTGLVLDEIGNTGRVACLPSIATLGRSLGVHEYLFVQNLKMLNAYNEPGDGGAGRDKLLGSIGIKAALCLSEPDDFKFFTALTGKRTVRSRGTGSQRARGRCSASTSYSEVAVPLVNEWEWQGRVPIRDGLLVVKGGENSAPGREGVFQLPLDYANRTPAGPFFGLGSEDDERRKRADYYRRAEEAAEGEGGERTAPWTPDFVALLAAGDQRPAVHDEWEAWDE